MPGSELPERELPMTGDAGTAVAPEVRRKVWRSAPVRYGTAVLAVVAVALIQRFTVPQQEIAPFVLFFAGIAIASVYGGRGPGLLAALLASATGNYFFIPPFGQFTLHGSALIATCLSLISGVFVAIFCGALRKSLDEANAKAATLRRQAWIIRGQAELATEVRGELGEETTASQILSFVAHYLGAKVGVLYVMTESKTAERRATFACASSGDSAPPRSIQPGEGWVGRVALEGKLVSLSDIPEEHIRIVTATGESRPRHLVVAPLSGEGRTIGVIELGFLEDPGAATLEYIEAISELAGISLRSSAYRAQRQTLLDATQRQARELQTQQEELRVVNEELEEHSRALRESQARLEAQQAELEQTNTQLEEQTQALEQQRDDLSRAQVDLVEKADELTRANQYKSEFLANMSHELSTPLNSALILAKLLSDNKDGNLTPEQVKYAATIHSSGNDLLVLINDILDLSRIEAGRMELQSRRWTCHARSSLSNARSSRWPPKRTCLSRRSSPRGHQCR